LSARRREHEAADGTGSKRDADACRISEPRGKWTKPTHLVQRFGVLGIVYIIGREIAGARPSGRDCADACPAQFRNRLVEPSRCSVPSRCAMPPSGQQAPSSKSITTQGRAQHPECRSEQCDDVRWQTLETAPTHPASARRHDTPPASSVGKNVAFRTGVPLPGTAAITIGSATMTDFR